MRNNNMSKEMMMQRVREAAFALIDIGLYLDTHPDDEKAMDYYNKYQQINKDVRRAYESTFGPLTSNTVDTCDGWTWVRDPWSWEGGCN